LKDVFVDGATSWIFQTVASADRLWGWDGGDSGWDSSGGGRYGSGHVASVAKHLALERNERSDSVGAEIFGVQLAFVWLRDTVASFWARTAKNWASLTEAFGSDWVFSVAFFHGERLGTNWWVWLTEAVSRSCFGGLCSDGCCCGDSS
jgi:hypothetical protein